MYFHVGKLDTICSFKIDFCIVSLGRSVQVNLPTPIKRKIDIKNFYLKYRLILNINLYSHLLSRFSNRGLILTTFFHNPFQNVIFSTGKSTALSVKKTLNTLCSHSFTPR